MDENKLKFLIVCILNIINIPIYFGIVNILDHMDFKPFWNGFIEGLLTVWFIITVVLLILAFKTGIEFND